MKHKTILSTLLLSFIVILLFSSCEDDDWSVDKTNNHVNQWIYNDVMSKYYYWNEMMDSPSDFSQDTEKFFESLLYKRREKGGDRFSWIQSSYVDLLNALQGVSSYDLGFKYQFLQEQNTNNVYAIIIYVKPNTHAAQKKLKRGMAVAEVNGIKLNTKNYLDVFPSGLDTYKLGILSENDQLEHIEVEPEINYAENPVFLDTVYTYNSTKTGYIVYNFFASDNGDNSYSYDKQLADIFNSFNQSGVKNVILDLRYNNGGSVESTKYIASALLPDRQTNKVFFQYEYNRSYSQTLKEEDLYSYFTDKINNSYAIPRLGDNIDKLYILTGKGSASASELIINGLMPYMESKIIQIGDVSYGKNVASATFYRKNDKHNRWGIQPIIAKLLNANESADYENGFTPDYILKEYDNYMYDLGDRRELLLNKALTLITGENISSDVSRSNRTKNHNILLPDQGKVDYNMYINPINIDF